VIAILGYLAVVTALGAGVTLVGTVIRQYSSPSPAAIRLPVTVLFVSSLVAFGALELGLLTDDFSIAYIAENHSTTTPFAFTIATAWAALEGSILLWGLVLAGTTSWASWHWGFSGSLPSSSSGSWPRSPTHSRCALS
jgi:cytochrome c-type biogenesis protein CcmF